MSLKYEPASEPRQVKEIYTLVVGAASKAGQWCTLKALAKVLPSLSHTHSLSLSHSLTHSLTHSLPG